MFYKEASWHFPCWQRSLFVKESEGSDTSSVKPVGKISSETGLAKQIVRILRAELRWSDSVKMAACMPSVVISSFVMLFESALSYVINWYFQRWNCESSDGRTKERNIFCFIGPRYICLPSNWIRLIFDLPSCSRKNRFNITWSTSLVVMAIFVHAR